MILKLCQANHFIQEFHSKWVILTSLTQSKPSHNCKVDLHSHKNNNTSEIPSNIKSWLEMLIKLKDVIYFIDILVINLRECFKFEQRKYVEFCLAHKAPGTTIDDAARELGYRKWSVHSTNSFKLYSTLSFKQYF